MAFGGGFGGIGFGAAGGFGAAAPTGFGAAPAAGGDTARDPSDFQVQLQPGTDTISAVAFSPTGQHLAFSSWDGKVRRKTVSLLLCNERARHR
jgi:hypothetical protein